MTLLERVKLWLGILEKQCTACNEIKSIDEFYNNIKGKYGKGSRCKECNKKHVREWKRKNR